MNKILKDLKPGLVFGFFEEISQIPRGSGNERAISDYFVSFAKARKLEFIQDKALNVIIRKPAAKGYENAPIVILQGHMDMVCEKNKETIHDFEKDPIKLRIIDDMIYATDTTLGADNGIAAAMMLALLDSEDIPHPAIEALFTSDEDCTMGGANYLDASHLKGKLLINIDSEEEGKLLVSSSGGIKAKLSLPVQSEAINTDLTAFRISIGGLKGGHSGMDIGRGRGNASKLMGRILNDLLSEFAYRLMDINGGSKSNAITREAEAVIFISSVDIHKLEHKICKWDEIFCNEFSASDPDVFVKLEQLEGAKHKALTKESMDKAIATLVLLPNGVKGMSMHINGLVETSTNLGVVQTMENEIIFVNEVRSSVGSMKYSVYNQICKISEIFGGTISVDSDYPEWAYKPDSPLRKLFEKVYKDKYSKEAEVVALHAGLECSIFSQKIEGLDCISIGPNLYDVHTPNEHLSISSTSNLWEYLLEVLKEMKTL